MPFSYLILIFNPWHCKVLERRRPKNYSEPNMLLLRRGNWARLGSYSSLAAELGGEHKSSPPLPPPPLLFSLRNAASYPKQENFHHTNKGQWENCFSIFPSTYSLRPSHWICPFTCLYAIVIMPIFSQMTKLNNPHTDQKHEWNQQGGVLGMGLFHNFNDCTSS